MNLDNDFHELNHQLMPTLSMLLEQGDDPEIATEEYRWLLTKTWLAYLHTRSLHQEIRMRDNANKTASTTVLNRNRMREMELTYEAYNKAIQSVRDGIVALSEMV